MVLLIENFYVFNDMNGLKIEIEILELNVFVKEGDGLNVCF